MTSELGGFADYIEDIDGTEVDYVAFNYCLADEYMNAFYNEDFEALGEISTDLFQKICKWYGYVDGLENKDKINGIKNGKLITIKGRTIIDAIYENKIASLAETYLLMDIFSPKLLLTIVLSDDDEYGAYIISKNQYELDDKLKQLYDFIESEYNVCEDKKGFLNKIKSNYNRLLVQKGYKLTPIPNNYNWVKKLKK